MLIMTRYEEEVARLRHELESRGGASHLGAPSHSAQPPPSVGHGPSNLFGGIMAGAAGQGGPGLAPPPQEQPQNQNLPGHMPQGPPGLNPPPGPPQPSFGGYPPAPSANGMPYQFSEHWNDVSS